MDSGQRQQLSEPDCRRARDIQDVARPCIRKGVSLVEELIRDRRCEEVRGSETVASYTWGMTRIEPGTVRILDLAGVKATREDLAAMRRAQAIVRKRIPEGVSLVEELIAERRRDSGVPR